MGCLDVFNSFNITVGNNAKEADTIELLTLFRKFGKTKSIAYASDRGTAIIGYGHSERVKNAVKEMHGYSYKGKELKVQYVDQGGGLPRMGISQRMAFDTPSEFQDS